MNVPEVSLLLTSDLLVTRISRGKIKPAYAAFDSKNLELAGLLIDTFEQHVGKTYGALLEELEGYEEMNYRFIRGLSQLLGRRTVIETDAVVDSSLAREAVFEACGGMALSPAERRGVLEKAANNLLISVPDLEKSLWADLEENQILKSFLSLSPEELLKQYNISLTQTLLFRAVDLDIWITGDFQRILWKILRSGLMYSLEDVGEVQGKKQAEKKTESRREGKKEGKREGENGEKSGEKYEIKGYDELRGVHLHLDGPASLFRMSERYGNSFAKLFPTLLQSKGWRLKAGILHKGFQGKRILEFTLDYSEEAFKPSSEAIRYARALSSGLQLKEACEEYKAGKSGKVGEKDETLKKDEIVKEYKTEFIEEETEIREIAAEEAAYDSKLEQTFGSLSLGNWKAKREPTILKAGNHAFIPDFSLQRDGMRVYLEIVGFWTPEYLGKKIEKLRDVKEPLILLIDRKLKCSEKDFPAQEVIFFDKKIPANEVMKVLRKYEEKKLVEDLSRLQDMEIPFSGELINLEEIAAEKGVLPDALKKEITDRLKKSDEVEKVGVLKRSEELEKPEELKELEKYGNYVLLENYLMSRQLLNRINFELEKSGTVETYAGAVKIFKDFGLDSSLYYPVLEYLGYKVIWTGLSEENARVKKAQK